MRLSRLLPVLLAVALFALLPACAQSVADAGELAAQAERHLTEEWRQLEPHLPAKESSSPEVLQQEGDVLRARRFEEDALEFYRAALKRGGDEATLINRIGVTELVLRRPELARACFRRALELRPKDAPMWNNLGAAEYAMHNHRAAKGDYVRALKLDRKSALFHSNLGTTYFAMKDYESATAQFQAALRLDPHLFERAGVGGIDAHMMTTDERGRFCFELARVAAGEHRDAAVLEWLGKALDVNFDVHNEMQRYAVFSPYLKDARVHLLISNAQALHGRRVASNTPIPPLSTVGPE